MLDGDAIIDMIFLHKWLYQLDPKENPYPRYEEFKKTLKAYYNAENINDKDYSKYMSLYIKVVGL